MSLVLATPAFGAGTVLVPATTSPEAAGTTPAAIAVGDLNGDGRPDLAVANQLSLDISILLGDGSGNFSPVPPNPAAGLRPTAIAVGNFNGDQAQDLAVTNSNSNDVTILLGDGAGGFSPAATSPEGLGMNMQGFGADPASVGVGDFDGNGKQDLAVANKTNNVSILLGNGTGDFTTPASSPEKAGAGPESIAVGDFDGNGKQDLAVANVSSNDVTILLGDGSGDFSAAATSPEPGGVGPRSVVPGDFDANGKQDLAVVAGSGGVSILLGDGSGNFSAAPSSPVSAGALPVAVAVGDLDADGKQDLAVVDANPGTGNGSSAQSGGSGTGTVTSLLGDGTGAFPTRSPITAAVGFNPRAVAIGDFDASGLQDVAVANGGDNTVTVLLGQPDGDGDGTADAADLCIQLAGVPPTGCPAVARRVTLAVSEGVLAGQIKATTRSCRSRQTVLIGHRVHGRDKRAGKTRADKRGRFTFDKSLPPGTYFAFIAERTIRDVATCAEARSRSIRVNG